MYINASIKKNKLKCPVLQVKGESAEGGTDVTSTKTADEEGEERVETADEAVADPVRVARDASSPVLAAAGGTDKTSLGDTGATDVSQGRYILVELYMYTPVYRYIIYRVYLFCIRYFVFMASRDLALTRCGIKN